MTNITQLIKDQGGILSGRLAEQIVKVDGISQEAARKRVERLKSPLHRLTGIFADNQRFIYHAENYNTPLYFEALKQAIEDSAKRCQAIVTAINYHYGLILKHDLANYSFSPVTNIKGHVRFSTLVEKLENINILLDYDSDHYCLNQFFADDNDPNVRHFKAIQFSKQLLVNQFANWSRNIGLTSFKTGELNKEVGGFQFSFASPSYINGLVQYNQSKPKPGFVVMDVLIGNSTTSNEVDFFIQKISAIRGSHPTTKLFPVLIVDGVESTGFNRLKKIGVLIASVREIFGESYNELLKNLINTITNAGAILKKDPESYINLMSQLTKLVDGKTNNLRGDLFELAVGYYYGKKCQSLDIGRKVRLENSIQAKQIDVLAVYESEVRVVECKGYNYPIDQEYIETYLSENIPHIRKWVEKTFPNRRQVFEIWSTGGYG